MKIILYFCSMVKLRKIALILLIVLLLLIIVWFVYTRIQVLHVAHQQQVLLDSVYDVLRYELSNY